MKEAKNVTISDIAKQADVSIGTVDRVLHNRGDVSEKTRRKVSTIIDEYGYKPNIYASILSQNKNVTIGAIIPYFQKGEFWELIYRGVMGSRNLMPGIKIDIKIFYYNQFEIDSFISACRNALEVDLHGVLISPIYKDEAAKFVGRLNERKTPFVYIDTKLEKSGYLAYFGMPLFESGYLAADILIGKNRDVKYVVSFNIDRGEAPPNDSTLQRNQGFLTYLEEFNPECRFIDCTMSPHDYMSNIKLFDDFFEKNPDVDHIITFNSRAHLISDWIELRGVTGKKLLGFDMLESNLKALKRGIISTLITERTDVEASRAIKTLVDFIVLKQNPAKKDNFSSIDILNRYNVDFYVHD